MMWPHLYVIHVFMKAEMRVKCWSCPCGRLLPRLCTGPLPFLTVLLIYVRGLETTLPLILLVCGATTSVRCFDFLFYKTTTIGTRTSHSLAAGGARLLMTERCPWYHCLNSKAAKGKTGDACGGARSSASPVRSFARLFRCRVVLFQIFVPRLWGVKRGWETVTSQDARLNAAVVNDVLHARHRVPVNARRWRIVTEY